MLSSPNIESPANVDAGVRNLLIIASRTYFARFNSETITRATKRKSEPWRKNQ